MKNKTVKDELKQLSADELHGKIVEWRQELCTLRINTVTAPVKDCSQFNKIRKNIARSLTYLRQKNA